MNSEGLLPYICKPEPDIWISITWKYFIQIYQQISFFVAVHNVKWLKEFMQIHLTLSIYLTQAPVLCYLCFLPTLVPSNWWRFPQREGPSQRLKEKNPWKGGGKDVKLEMPERLCFFFPPTKVIFVSRKFLCSQCLFMKHYSEFYF